MPIEPVYFRGVGADGPKRLFRPAIVPNVQPSVVARRQDVRVLGVELNLGSASEPVAKSQDGLTGPAQIPAVHVTIDGRGGHQVHVVKREVDICNSAAVPTERVLNGASGRIIAQIEVPDQGAMVGSRDDPIVATCKWGPLHINNQPRLPGATETTGRVVRTFEIDDGEAFRASIERTRSVLDFLSFAGVRGRLI